MGAGNMEHLTEMFILILTFYTLNAHAWHLTILATEQWKNTILPATSFSPCHNLNHTNSNCLLAVTHLYNVHTQRKRQSKDNFVEFDGIIPFLLDVYRITYAPR